MTGLSPGQFGPDFSTDSAGVTSPGAPGARPGYGQPSRLNSFAASVGRGTAHVANGLAAAGFPGFGNATDAAANRILQHGEQRYGLQPGALRQQRVSGPAGVGSDLYHSTVSGQNEYPPEQGWGGSDQQSSPANPTPKFDAAEFAESQRQRLPDPRAMDSAPMAMPTPRAPRLSGASPSVLDANAAARYSAQQHARMVGTELAGRVARVMPRQPAQPRQLLGGAYGEARQPGSHNVVARPPSSPSPPQEGG